MSETPATETSATGTPAPGTSATGTSVPGRRFDGRADAPPLLEVAGVTKTFGHGRRRLTALDGVDLRLRGGETLGLVGESGCGKSTLARVLLGLERPDAGTVRFDGTDPFTLRGKALLAWRRRVQMVFQDPFASLNARMSAADLIGEPWRTHRDVVPTAQARERRVRELLSLVGLRESDAHRYPDEFSGGQRQRIGIARALALDPDLIVCDEPVSALDLSVQAQVLNVLSELRERLGVSYVFISHDLSVVRYVADRVTVMYLGKVVEHGRTEDVFDRPLHPYTAALMSAAPVLDASRAAEDAEIRLRGEIPSPYDIPSGCRFRTRCWQAEDRCADLAPPAVSRADAGDPGRPGQPHAALCHFPLAGEQS
ncbi:ABC transporter ATP-binding protein [Streptomyces sp. NRRL F-5135]|uniref:ABC transporter ATP-binding protein n=1 Tax=Streptomyces sp. NRRL F-5135 TaxID=1463858 RepID=UPI000AD10306